MPARPLAVRAGVAERAVAEVEGAEERRARVALRVARLGFGRIAISENEAPTISPNLVYSG